MTNPKQEWWSVYTKWTAPVIMTIPKQEWMIARKRELATVSAKFTHYDQWFDAQHLIEHVGRECPRMRIVYPDQLADPSNQTDLPSIAVKSSWHMNISLAPGISYFWSGRPFKDFFDKQYAKRRATPAPGSDRSTAGITIITIEALFLLFRITDDATGQDLKLWNDLSRLIRFREPIRRITNYLVAQIGRRPFYGVHFRVESDSVWSSLDTQLKIDLDALDGAWTKYGRPGAQKPLVYVACGDQEQIDQFVKAGKARGWEVTHKWQLAQGNAKVWDEINELAFDFKGAVDMGILTLSHFFVGIISSTLSLTVGHARDPTGRYRGSSLTIHDDGNARTYLSHDHDQRDFACCL